MHNKLITILKYSKILSLKSIFLFWAIIFIYSVLVAGHFLYGILSLLFIVFGALTVNIAGYLSDYIDFFNNDCNKESFLEKNKKFKPLISGVIKPNYIYSAIALGGIILLLFGTFLYIKTGKLFINLMIFSLVLSVLIIFRRKIVFSDLLPSFFYAPLIFCITYFLMTKTITADIILLSIPYILLSSGRLYIDSIKDYDFNSSCNKQTIANLFDSQLDALVVFKWILYLIYFSPLILCAFDILDWQILLTYATIPIAMNLYNDLKEYASEKENEENDLEKVLLKSNKLVLRYCIISIIAIILSAN